MCGIVGGVAQRDISPILLEGLRRLEYRGYDSAGMAVVNNDCLSRQRKLGKVVELAKALKDDPIAGGTGIAHTRWATHGAPSESNAHPHICNDLIAVVHNGIIENYEELQEQQKKAGYKFTSETDTEVVAHQITQYYKEEGDLLKAVYRASKDFTGAYSLGVIARDKPEELIAAREGSPVVIGLGIGENFIASDVQALLPVTQQMIYLENGDVARITRESVEIYDVDFQPVERQVSTSVQSAGARDRGEFKHYMLKEIFEQPEAINQTLQGRLADNDISDHIFGTGAGDIFDQVRRVQIVACGTSYHAGLVAKHWFESIAGIGCDVEVASEIRYRTHVVEDNTLFVTISQSGETADTLAALMQAGESGYLASMAICNVSESSLVRESDLVLMTHAGPEIGVASTKAFTTQLVALLLLLVAIGKRNSLETEQVEVIISLLKQLPTMIEAALQRDDEIATLANDFVDKNHALFLGRGIEYPIAMEGALKLKEISYIHAEAYPAGELKHGPLALVDEDMPVVAVAPNNILLEKLRSNLEVVRARGGKLYVFAAAQTGLDADSETKIVQIEDVPEIIAPIVNVVYLQLLAYHVAVLKGTDVDQPRNLAKSVTVE